jgi:hypothetical protein
MRALVLLCSPDSGGRGVRKSAEVVDRAPRGDAPNIHYTDREAAGGPTDRGIIVVERG